MAKKLLASDRVIFLLSLVPYLREHGPTSVEDLAKTFDVDQAQLRELVMFLGTAGIPGETLSYQHNDLFDIDWDALEVYDTVALTQTVAIDETPRFTGVETATLLAGLHALEPMLSDGDAAVARGLAARLKDVFGVTGTPSVTVADVKPDERLAQLLTAVDEQRRVTFSYRTADGLETERQLAPTRLSEHEGVWYVTGLDLGRSAERMFRVDRTSNISVQHAEHGEHRAQILQESGQHDPEPHEPEPHKPEQRESITARVPLRLLPALRGFAPKTLEELPGGIALVSIDGWHAGAAVRLVQHGPGEIEIVSPLSARAAVSEWAEIALAAYGD